MQYITISPLTVIVVARPTHGTISGYQSGDLSIETGRLYYNPETHFVGTDTFTYKLTDGVHESNVATVTINVTNATPIGQADQYAIVEVQVLRVTAGGTSGGSGSGGGGPPSPGGGSPTSPPAAGPTLLANDTDADADILRSLLVTDVSHGTLVLHDDGGFIYTPTPNFTGIDSFTYQASDGIVDSAATTVTITVGRNPSADIDGHDGTTHTPWMSEPDEGEYGLAVGTSTNSQILLRDPPVPIGSTVTNRLVTWDSSKLTVNGVTSQNYIVLPLSGDVTYSVVAKYAGYEASSISYHVGWIDPDLDLGHQQIVQLKVVEKKAVLLSIEFTSDHNVLRDNTLQYDVIANRYEDVEYQSTGYEAPISQNRDTKLVAKVTFDTANIPIGTTYKLIGTSTEAAYIFDSGNKLATGGQETITVTATNTLGKAIRIAEAEIKWTMVLNPGTPADNVSLGKATRHTTFITYGRPDGVKVESLPTYIRMEIAMVAVQRAYTNAKAIANTSDPKPARLVYELLKLHVFNLKNGIAQKGTTEVKGWTVPKYWTHVYNLDKHIPEDKWAVGGDCVSGAIFSKLAALMVGLPGTIDVKTYSPKSVAEPKVAIEYENRKELWRGTQEQPEHLVLFDKNGGNNEFEATVIYNSGLPGTKTYYFPSGTESALIYDNPNDVLSVFPTFEWAVLNPAKTRWIKTGLKANLIAEWTKATNVTTIDE